MSASNHSWGTAVRGEAGFRIVLAVMLALAIACCVHVYEDGLNSPPISGMVLLLVVFATNVFHYSTYYTNCLTHRILSGRGF